MILFAALPVVIVMYLLKMASPDPIYHVDENGKLIDLNRPENHYHS